MNFSLTSSARSIAATLRATRRAGRPLFETTFDADLMRQEHELRAMSQMAPQIR